MLSHSNYCSSQLVLCVIEPGLHSLAGHTVEQYLSMYVSFLVIE